MIVLIFGGALTFFISSSEKQFCDGNQLKASSISFFMIRISFLIDTIGHSLRSIDAIFSFVDILNEKENR